MKIKTEVLYSELWEMTRKNREQAKEYMNLSLEVLQFKPGPMAWNTLECLEHLNLYGNFYLPEIENRIVKSKYGPQPEFRSGILGNYFAKSMLPSLNMKKIKTFKDKNPTEKKLDLSTIQRFIEQQDKTMELLEASRHVSLNRTRTSISISGLIKLKLGDTLRVVIFHNLRHIEQANHCIRMSAINNPVKA